MQYDEKIEKEKNTPFTLGYLKKRILLSLGYFDVNENVVTAGTRTEEINSAMASAVQSAYTEICTNCGIEQKVPFIDEFTNDETEMMLEGCAFEALVCLAASRLCSEKESELYTRLLYKYKDLCEGLYGKVPSAKNRNGFYDAASKRGVK